MATVTPIRPDVAIPENLQRAPCVTCGSRVDWDFYADCSHCHAPMHEVCYYGRVADMEEWLAFLRVIASGDDYPQWPDRRCPACRASGKEGV